MSINSISSDKSFRKTPLYREFRKKPFGFIDVGSMDGVHASVEPVAALTEATCFEPNPQECAKLEDFYKDNSVYGNVRVFPLALWDRKLPAKKIYITRKATNCSFFKPSEDFVKRYRAVMFEKKGAATVQCDTLDHVLSRVPSAQAQFMKLDTQGSEFEILKGAVKTLEKKTLGILCEVEFMQIYENQKTFSDVDRLLRAQGFCLYGLYPHYRSTKALDRKSHDTEERLLWADAFYLKDPLDPLNKGRRFSERDVLALILIALLNGYYDVAYEWADTKIHEGKASLLAFIEKYSRSDAGKARKEIKSLSAQSSQKPREALLALRQFVSRHRRNSDVDYVSHGA